MFKAGPRTTLPSLPSSGGAEPLCAARVESVAGALENDGRGVMAAWVREWTDRLCLRPEIVAFSILMEREMLANAHKDDHPLSHDFDHLALELRGHVEKFASNPTEEHAADVANLAMLALAEVSS